MEQPTSFRRRALLRLIRRAGAATSVALIVLALFMFSTISVSVPTVHDTAHELINGHSDSSSLLLPLGLFAVGVAGLAACLRW